MGISPFSILPVGAPLTKIVAYEFWYDKVTSEILPDVPFIDASEYDSFLMHLGSSTEAQLRWHGPFYDGKLYLPLPLELKSMGAYFVYYRGAQQAANPQPKKVSVFITDEYDWIDIVRPLWSSYLQYRANLNKDNVGVVSNF